MSDILEGVYVNGGENKLPDGETMQRASYDVQEFEEQREHVNRLVQNINDCVVVDKELEESVTIKTLRTALNANAADAVRLLANVDISRTDDILKLKAICYCNKFFEDIIIGMRNRATEAAAQLKEMGF